jgi:hypothetical protein
MPADRVRQIELRRLQELRAQAALHGPNTEPAILIEIQELQTKYPDWNGNGSRADYDYEFLMNTVAAALVRLTRQEERQDKESKDREQRQAELDKRLGDQDDKLDKLLVFIPWIYVVAAVAIVAFVVGVILAIKVF